MVSGVNNSWPFKEDFNALDPTQLTRSFHLEGQYLKLRSSALKFLLERPGVVYS